MRFDITNTQIEDYLASIAAPRPPVLAELEKKAYQRGLPLLGPVQGQFMHLLATCLDARSVLEIGTATGYAALWFLLAVAPKGGHLTATERHPERAALARETVAQAGLSEHFSIHEGDAFNILPTLAGQQFDIVFLDILRSLPEPDMALRALELCKPLVRPGGLLITDNVLCNALVLEEDPSPTVRGIQQYNLAIMADPDFESTIIPLRDGIAISRKKA
jgi:predicted O-methyltransferase YrrM